MDRQVDIPDGERGCAFFVGRRARFDAVFSVGNDFQRAGTGNRHLGAILAFEDGVLRVRIVRIIVVVVFCTVGQGVARAGGGNEVHLGRLVAGDRRRCGAG